MRNGSQKKQLNPLQCSDEMKGEQHARKGERNHDKDAINNILFLLKAGLYVLFTIYLHLGEVYYFLLLWLDSDSIKLQSYWPDSLGFITIAPWCLDLFTECQTELHSRIKCEKSKLLT